MKLTYLDARGSPGKTSDATDVVDVGFAELVSPRLVVQRAEFAADDPAYAAIMTMTWRLDAFGEGTEVSVTAVDVPPGIDQEAHQAAIASSLANLASFVENNDRRLADRPSRSVTTGRRQATRSSASKPVSPSPPGRLLSQHSCRPTRGRCGRPSLNQRVAPRWLSPRALGVTAWLGQGLARPKPAAW